MLALCLVAIYVIVISFAFVSTLWVYLYTQCHHIASSANSQYKRTPVSYTRTAVASADAAAAVVLLLFCCCAAAVAAAVAAALSACAAVVVVIIILVGTVVAAHCSC